MNAIPLTHIDDEAIPGSAHTDASSGHSTRNTLIEDDARQLEKTRCVLLQMSMVGCLIMNREAVDFARGIAEIMIWSGEHARNTAIAKATTPGDEAVEWICTGCGETVPENFELCWNCERDRPTWPEMPK